MRGSQPQRVRGPRRHPQVGGLCVQRLGLEPSQGIVASAAAAQHVAPMLQPLGDVKLQNHNTPVRYRSLWLRRLKARVE